jgi:alpha/beta superfamily hydrolase
MVNDGFTLTDTLTGARRRYERKVDAVRAQALILDSEAAIDWSALSSWHASFGGYVSSGLIEVRGVDANGIHVLSLCAVARSSGDDDAPTRANIARWLQAMGHADLPELQRAS